MLPCIQYALLAWLGVVAANEKAGAVRKESSCGRSSVSSSAHDFGCRDVLLRENQEGPQVSLRSFVKDFADQPLDHLRMRPPAGSGYDYELIWWGKAVLSPSWKKNQQEPQVSLSFFVKDLADQPLDNVRMRFVTGAGHDVESVSRRGKAVLSLSWKELPVREKLRLKVICPPPHVGFSVETVLMSTVGADFGFRSSL